jgi:hypothetical protein
MQTRRLMEKGSLVRGSQNGYTCLHGTIVKSTDFDPSSNPNQISHWLDAKATCFKKGRLFKNKPLSPQWRLHPVLFGALVRSCLSFWGLLERASRPGCPANTYFGAAHPWVGSRCPALWFFLHYPFPEPAWKITYFTKGLRYSSRNVWPTEVRSTSTSMASMVSKPSKHDWFETLSSREYCACDRTLSPKATQTW